MTKILNVYMLIKRKTWRDQAWCLLSFPKRNRTILWNDTLKTYDIYKGVIKDDSISSLQAKTNNKIELGTNPATWRGLCLALAASLGIALGVIVCLLSFT